MNNLPMKYALGILAAVALLLPLAIEYGTDNSISIGLAKKPLRVTRLKAEKALRTFFPLSDADLCSLNITVVTPGKFDAKYGSENLGLSFCPGAVRLP